jgi:hypothetical protein
MTVRFAQTVTQFQFPVLSLVGEVCNRESPVTTSQQSSQLQMRERQAERTCGTRRQAALRSTFKQEDMISSSIQAIIMRNDILYSYM